MLWPLMALGGRNVAVAVSFAVVCVLHAVSTVPAIGGQLDRALCLIVACVVVQLIPLPQFLGGFLSPHADVIRGALDLGPHSSTWKTISIDPRSSALAGIELVGAVALFFSAREQFARGGVRRTSRAIAAIGFAVAILAMAQAATGGRDIYWLFPTGLEGPPPFGPFVNRNHFATWVIMAIPLCVG